MKYNSTAPNVFTYAMKVTDLGGMWHTKLICYSLCVSARIYPSELKQVLVIHDFRPTWSFPIIAVFVTRAKFLELLAHYSVSYFAPGMFLVASVALWLSFHIHLHVLIFLIRHRVKQCTSCQQTNTYYMTTYRVRHPELPPL